MADNGDVTGERSALQTHGFIWLRSAFATPTEAFATSQELVDECVGPDGSDALSVIGEFILPPPNGEATRDFQTLHFDFGPPLNPHREQDLARYTVLYIPRSTVGVTAATRLVAVDTLLAQRHWPHSTTLLDNLIAYGESHGAWDDSVGYSEGSLARLIEAAAGAAQLPSVKSTPASSAGRSSTPWLPS